MDNLPSELLVAILANLPVAEAWRARRVSRAWQQAAVDAVAHRLQHGGTAPFQLTIAINWLRQGRKSYLMCTEECAIDMRLRSYNPQTGVFEFAPQRKSRVTFDAEKFGNHNNVKGSLQWRAGSADSFENAADNHVALASPSCFRDYNVYRRAEKTEKTFTFVHVSRRTAQDTEARADDVDSEIIVHEPQSTLCAHQEQHLFNFNSDLKYSVHSDAQKKTMSLRIHHFRITEAGLFSLISPETKHMIPERGLFPGERVDILRRIAKFAGISASLLQDSLDTDIALGWLSGETSALNDLDRIFWLHAIQNML